ncbi:hypothetical protein ACHQM5_005896 [Ranunculus cassubicifolius]
MYQPIESLYLIIVTNKQSNIFEDLETLTLFSKIVSEYCTSPNEEDISKFAFELIFAFSEVVSLGYRECSSVDQVKQYCAMVSEEEKLHKLERQKKIKETKDVMRRRAQEIDQIKLDMNGGVNGGVKSNNYQHVDLREIERMLREVDIYTHEGDTELNMDSNGVSLRSSIEGRAYTIAPAPSKGGMKLGQTKKTTQILKSLKAEGEFISHDVQPSDTQSKSVARPIDPPITLTVEEKVNVTLKRDGGVSNFDLKGQLLLQTIGQENVLAQVQIEGGENSGIHLELHPKIDKDKFNKDRILAIKDFKEAKEPLPRGGDAGGAKLLRWRMQSLDESMVPLTINCWPSDSKNETCVSLEYEATAMFDLQNVVISIPLPSLKEAPKITQVNGECKYDSQSSTLEWSMLLIDNSNHSGSMEFVVPRADSSVFFPICVRFTSQGTFSNMKVVNVVPLHGGPSANFSQKSRLIAESYQVV